MQFPLVYAYSCEASPEEIAALAEEDGEKKKPSKPRTSAKTKAAPKHPRSPQKPDQSSPNPVLTKRLKGKQSEPDQATLIKDLMEVPS